MAPGSNPLRGLIVAGLFLALAIVASAVFLAAVASSQSVTALVAPPGPRPAATIAFPPGIGFEPQGVDANPDTGYVYVASKRSDEVVVLSGTQVITAVTVDTWDGGSWSLPVRVNPTNGYTYVAGSYITIMSGTAVLTDVVYKPSPYDKIGPAAMEVNSGTGYVYVALQGDRNTVLVLSDTRVISQVVMTSMPGAIGVNPSTGYVYVTADDSVAVLSGTAVITQVVLNNPQAIGVNPQTSYVYAALLDGQVAVLSGTEVVDILPVGNWPVDVGCNPHTGYVYVANFYSNDVTVIRDRNVVTTLPAGLHPARVGINVDTGYVYVANDGGPSGALDTVTVISGTQVVTTVPVGDWPRDVAINERTGYGYITNAWSNDVTVVEGITVVATVPTGAFPLVIARNPVSGRFYIADSIGDRVWVISGTSVIGKLAVGDYPLSLAVNSTDGLVYVANRRSCTVDVISDTAVLATLDVGCWPLAVAAAPSGHVCVVAEMDHAVTVIQGTVVVTQVTGPIFPNTVKVNPYTGLVYAYGLGNHTVMAISGTQLIGLPVMPYGVQDVASDPQTGYAYVLDESGVSILQGLSLTAYLELGDPGPGSLFHAIEFNPVSGYAYLANRPQDTVVVVSGTRVIALLPAGDEPYDIVADPGSPRVYVANRAGGDVTVIAGTQVVNTIPLEANEGRAVSIAVDPVSGTVYAADFYGHIITVLTLQPDFNLAPLPPVWTIPSGTVVTRTISLVSQLGFTQPVTLTITGWPSGAVGLVAPNPAAPTGTAVVTITSAAEMPLGPHILTLTGMSGGISHRTQFPLLLFSGRMFLQVLIREQSP